jgi:hypothetical protein
LSQMRLPAIAAANAWARVQRHRWLAEAASADASLQSRAAAHDFNEGQTRFKVILHPSLTSLLDRHCWHPPNASSHGT